MFDPRYSANHADTVSRSIKRTDTSFSNDLRGTGFRRHKFLNSSTRVSHGVQLIVYFCCYRYCYRVNNLIIYVSYYGTRAGKWRTYQFCCQDFSSRCCWFAKKEKWHTRICSCMTSLYVLVSFVRVRLIFCGSQPDNTKFRDKTWFICTTRWR